MNKFFEISHRTKIKNVLKEMIDISTTINDYNFKHYFKDKYQFVRNILSNIS